MPSSALHIFGDFVIVRGPWLVLTAIGLVCFFLYQQAYGTDVPFIRGIPSPPGAVPFYGHLKALGKDHPTQFEKWGKEYNWPVIQARFGSRRVIVLNSFEAAQAFIVKNASATIGRPLFYTFHKVLSTSQGPTIGTSPWDETTKKRRTVVSKYLTRPAIKKSGPMLDTESFAFVHDLFEGTKHGTSNINSEIYTKRLALNLTMMICYGTRYESVDDPNLKRILQIAETVSTFRSTNKNWQDFVPYLRYLPGSGRSKQASLIREERDIWLNELLTAVNEAVRQKTAKPCITESMLAEDGVSNIDMGDLKSINVSLVSGGFETVATTASAGLGLLAKAEGQAIQEKAYNDLMQHYSSVEEAWDAVVTEEASEYTVALVREMLRYFTAIQFLPARQTEKEFVWEGIKIPKGVTVIQNAQAINHDKSFYGMDADKFRPERWLEDEKNDVTPPAAPYHYSFGAGSRACPAIAISNRLLYTTFARLILLFRIKPGQDGKVLDTDYVGYNRDTTLQTCKPKEFSLRLAPRNEDSTMTACFEKSRAHKF